ncbi:MAG: hypothetical protein GF410_16745 [Chitinivibrionales bacterium]|nr:hypothetical protein [Chitinivibrionales bacterium]
MKVRLNFVEEVLGTASANPDIHREFIAANGPDAKTRKEEVEAIGVDTVVEKSTTVFPRDADGDPMFWDYQIKGFFKDACSMLARVGGKGNPQNLSGKLKAYKKVIDGMVFVAPRKIKVVIPEGMTLGNCQRPLRGQTAQGERIALANSETIPAGSVIEFEVKLLDKQHEKLVREWLDYGVFRGIGQWRNSGKGRFEWEEVG